MPAKPFTAADFPGVAPEKVGALITEANGLAGIRSAEAAPATVATSRAAPPPAPAEQARGELDQIRADRASGKISDSAWRAKYEARVLELSGVADALKAYKAAPGHEQSAMRNDWQAGETQEAFERAIDAQKPAAAPHEYILPLGPNPTEDELGVDRMLRQAMHDAELPRETGNALALSVHETATALEAAEKSENPQAHRSVIQGYESRLRARWGGDFDRRVAVVDDFLEREAQRSPAVRALRDQAPEVFTAPDTMQYLYTAAESQKRRARR